MAKFNCGSMFHLWYLLLCGALHIFLIYNAIRRYIAYKTFVTDGTYGSQWSEAPQNFYLFCIVFALALLPLMLYTSIAWTGNYANDGLMLGVTISPTQYNLPLDGTRNLQNEYRQRQLSATMNCASSNASPGVIQQQNEMIVAEDKNNEEVSTALKKSDVEKPSSASSLPETHPNQLKRFCSHVLSASVPWFTFLHFLVAYLFVLPLPVLRANLIKHKVIDEDHVWRYPLEHELMVVSPHRASSLNLQPSSEILEILNLFTALLLLIYYYGNVFWFTHKVFAIIFSLLITALSVEIILQFFVIYVLYGLLFITAERQTSGEETSSLIVATTVNRIRSMVGQQQLLSGEALLAIAPMASLLFIISLVPVCQYGLQHFHRRHFMSSRLSHSTTGDACSDSGQSSENSRSMHRSRVSSNKSPDGRSGNSPTNQCFKKHYVTISGLVLLLIAAGFEMPIVLECFLMHRDTQRGLFLFNSLYNICLVCLWLVLWLAFSLKSSWSMKMQDIPRVDTTTSSLGVGASASNPPSYGASLIGDNRCNPPYASSISGLTHDPRFIGSSSPVNPLYSSYFDAAGANLQAQLAIASGLHPSILYSPLSVTNSHGSPSLMMAGTLPSAPSIMNPQHASMGDCYSEDTDGSGSRNIEDRGNYVYLQGSLQTTPQLGYHPRSLSPHMVAGGGLVLHPGTMASSVPSPPTNPNNPIYSTILGGNYLMMTPPQVADSTGNMVMNFQKSPISQHRGVGESFDMTDLNASSFYQQQQQLAQHQGLNLNNLSTPSFLMKPYADYAQFSDSRSTNVDRLNNGVRAADSPEGVEISACNGGAGPLRQGGTTTEMLMNPNGNVPTNMLDFGNIPGSVYVGANQLLQNLPGLSTMKNVQDHLNNQGLLPSSSIDVGSGSLTRKGTLGKIPQFTQQNSATPMARRGSNRVVTFKEELDSFIGEMTAATASLRQAYPTVGEETNSLRRPLHTTSSSDSGIENQTPRIMFVDPNNPLSQNVLSSHDPVLFKDMGLDNNIGRYFHGEMDPNASPRLNTAISPPLEYGNNKQSINSGLDNNSLPINLLTESGPGTDGTGLCSQV